MIATLNEKSKRIEIVTQDSAEFKQLGKFPGLLRDGAYFFTPLKLAVAFNVVNRLKRKFSKLQVSKEVTQYISQPFKLKQIPTSFKYHTQPKDFQEIALRYAYTVEGGGLLLEPGMGKTKVVLDFIALMGFKKSLIVCPKALLFVWEDEQALHRPDKSVYCIKGTEWEKEKEEIESADIVVVNYNKAVILLENLVDQNFGFIGVDEGLIKDPSSGRTKALSWLGKTIPHRMIMSGTLINNSPLDAFAPTRFLEPTLTGNSYYNFCEEYTVQAGPKDRRFVVGYKHVDEVREILESTSIVMTKEKWLKLPPKNFHDIWVEPSEEQREKYWELQSNYITKVGEKLLEVDSPLTALCKLIQIANGFVYTTNKAEIEELNGEEVKPVKRETYFFKEQPKIDRLIQLLSGELKGRRAMIWYNMEGEYELISKALQNSNFKWLSIRGGEKSTGDKVRTFNRDSSYDYLLCQSRAVNYGITVLGKEYEETDWEIFSGITKNVFTQVFYSLNFSLETYLQQQDRIHRLGQEHPCDYYRLFTKFLVENHVKEKIDEKMSIRGEMLQDIINKLGLIK